MQTTNQYFKVKKNLIEKKVDKRTTQCKDFRRFLTQKSFKSQFKGIIFPLGTIWLLER